MPFFNIHTQLYSKNLAFNFEFLTLTPFPEIRNICGCFFDLVLLLHCQKDFFVFEPHTHACTRRFVAP